jgi:hypothetical protein
LIPRSYGTDEIGSYGRKPNIGTLEEEIDWGSGFSMQDNRRTDRLGWREDMLCFGLSK